MDAEGNPLNPKTAADHQWSYTWEKLPRYIRIADTVYPIIWKAEEKLHTGGLTTEQIDGFGDNYILSPETELEGTPFSATLKNIAKTDIPVTKNWNDAGREKRRQVTFTLRSSVGAYEDPEHPGRGFIRR